MVNKEYKMIVEGQAMISSTQFSVSGTGSLLSTAFISHSPPSSFLVSVEDRVDRRAPLLPVPDSFTPLDPSPPREMVLMVNGFRSFCPSAKLSKDKKVWVKTQKQWWIFYACNRFKIECNYVYREDFLLIKFVQIPNIILTVRWFSNLIHQP